MYASANDGNMLNQNLKWSKRVRLGYVQNDKKMLLKIDMIPEEGIYLSCYIFHFRVFLYRKKKVVHKTVTTDDKRLQSTLKRLGVNSIPGIEEVNIFKDDSVIHFTNPKGKQILEDLIRNFPFVFIFLESDLCLCWCLYQSVLIQ